MTKYLILLAFAIGSVYLIRKSTAYLIPITLIIYSNINGLLDWEDFALKGAIKFPDYGLILTAFIVAINILKSTKYNNKYQDAIKLNPLHQVLIIFWVYYLFEFIYSILIHDDLEWPIKMGRVFFYGLTIFIAISELKPDPINIFNKVITALKYSTLFFGLLYVAYNLGGFDIYPKQEHEIFSLEDIGDIKRNFSGFPTFTFYFLIFFTNELLKSSRNQLFNYFGALLMAVCIGLTLTRGAVLSMVIILMITIAYRVPSGTTLRRTVIFGLSSLIFIPFLLAFDQGHLEVLMLRFGEFYDSGSATQSGNFLVRALEFSTIVSNVLDFNPLFGFGFTNVAELGYHSSLIHGGSADNGFSNIIGVTGFVGLTIFIILMCLWLVTNIKLQRLRSEPFSKVNFIFILYIFSSFFNGASMSYMHSYCLFMAYDLVALAYLTQMNARTNSLRYIPSKIPKIIQ